MIPQGTTITFQSSGFSAEILSIGIDFPREVYEATSYQDALAVFQASDLSMATIIIGLAFDPDQSPPIDQTTEQVDIQWPKSAGQTRGPLWRAQAFVVDYTPRASIDERMEASMDLQVSGGIHVFAGARILRIAPAGQGSYADATDEERQLYGWIADAGTGLMPNGDAPYSIAETA